MQSAKLTQWVRQKALEAGFSACGFSRAGFLEKEARDLEQFLNENRHGEMKWLENHFDKRTDPRLLSEGAKSVISVIHNYFPGNDVKQPEGAPRISTYAWGDDYHSVLKGKLHELLNFIKEKTGERAARIFTDSAPVMDKVWAAKAGLGWIGKHTNLIVPQAGSWFFIGEIIIDLEFEYDTPVKDHCGTCTRCIDACPTQALTPYQIDARKCISYLTIELRDHIPEEYKNSMNGWAYGCDICQDVCPWNSFSLPEKTGAFSPRPEISTYGKEDWEAMSEGEFKKYVKNTAMSRIKYPKWRDNLGI